MSIISSGLLTSFLGTWVGMQVMACKSDDTPTPPPPPPCTDGETMKEDYVVAPKVEYKDGVDLVVPSTVYVEVLIIIDHELYTKIGSTYKNGKWDASGSGSQIEAEVNLYARKFMSAVSIKFQGQFKNPKIKFVIRDVFKI